MRLGELQIGRFICHINNPEFPLLTVQYRAFGEKQRSSHMETFTSIPLGTLFGIDTPLTELSPSPSV